MHDAPIYTENDYKAAIISQYRSANAESLAAVVVDRDATVVFAGGGFDAFFGVDGDRVTSLAPFLPERMPADWHLALVARRYDQFKAALTAGEKVDIASMGGRNSARVTGMTSKGEVGIAVQLCPLLVGEEKTLFIVGFLQKTDVAAAEKLAKAAKMDAENVMGGKIFATADAAGERIKGGYTFLAYEVFKGIPGARLWAIALIFGLLAGGGYLFYIERRGDTNTQIRIEHSPVSPDLQPQER